MSHTFRLLPPVAATLAVTIGLVAGCQSAPPDSPLVAGGQATVNSTGPTAHVTADVSALFGIPGRRKLQAGSFAAAAIANVRLRAQGKQIAGELSATIPYVPNGQGPSTSPTTVSLVVPSGPNRLFTLEGLDSAGNVIATMRTLASLSPGSAQSLTINANTDAAARVLADLLAGPGANDQPDSQNANALLALQDEVTPLLAFVNSVTAYNAPANTYSGVPPVFFRDHVLADLLRTTGYDLLANPAPLGLKTNAGAAVTVTLTNGGTPLMNVPITIYDPSSPAVATNVAGIAQFTNIPPGTWTVTAALSGGLTAVGSVTVRDKEAGLTVALAASATVAPPVGGSNGNGGSSAGTGIGTLITVPVPGQTPVPDSITAPIQAQKPFVTTVAGGKPSLITSTLSFTNNANAVATVSGSGPSKVAYDFVGNGYTLAYNQILQLPPGGGFKRLAWSSAYENAGIITGSNLKAFSVTAAGDVYVLDSAKKLYKVVLTGPGIVAVTNIVTPPLSNPSDLVAAADGNLYIADGSSIVRVGLTASNNLAFSTGIPAGAITSDVDSNLYIVRTDSNEVWKIPSFTTTPAPALYSATDAGSLDGTSALLGAKQICANNTSPPTLYVADTGNNRIRVIAPNGANAGTMTTLAGLEIGQIEGNFANATFNRPKGVAFDGSVIGQPALLVADSFNGRLRRLNLTTSTTTTVMALQDPQFVEATGSNARFGTVNAVAVPPSGMPVIIDSFNNLMMQIGANNVTTRFAGTGQATSPTVAGPKLTTSLGFSPLQVVSGPTTDDLYALITGSKIVSITSTIAPLTLNITPKLIASDKAGNLYAITDDSTEMNLYALSPLGAETPVCQHLPVGIKSFAVDPNGGTPNFYLTIGSTIQKVSSTIATAAFVGGSATPLADGTGATAGFSFIEGICVDETAHALFVADLNRVRQVDLVTGQVTTLAGTGGSPDLDGAAASARFGTLSGIAIGTAGDLYVTESDRVRRIQR